LKPNLSRRQFLAHSAGIAGASLGLGIPRVGGSESGGEIRLGFIGVGDRGRHLLGAARACSREDPRARGAPRVRVAAICDVSPQNTKRALDLFRDAPAAGDRPRCFSSYRALLDDPEVDAVVIATPVYQHADQTITALAAGKHVYCEKPMAHSPEDCRRVLLAALAAGPAGRVYQAGFQRRYNARYRASARFARSGEAGRILFLRAQWHATGNSPKDKPWLFRREKSGGIVLEQACHQFDIFNWVLASTPLRACGFGGTGRFVNEPPGRDTMDHYGAVIEYPGGIRVQLSHVSFAIPDRRFSGIYELAFHERMGIDLANAIAWVEGGAVKQLAPDTASAGSHSDTQAAMEGFVESIATGKQPEANATVAYEATLAALLCQRALDTGQVAQWKEIEPA
jgi:predicted dehydrogenase